MCFIPNTHFNPNSAKTRIQNHLIYKLGLALILYDKQRKEKLKQLQIPNNNSKGHSIFPNNTLYPNNNQHLITPKDTLSNLKSNQESPNNHNQHPTTLKDTPSPNNNYNQHLITPNNTYASNMWGGGQNSSYLVCSTPLSFLKLLLSLYKIKQSHKKQQRFYKQAIQLFPNLKYPSLQSCKDYQQSLPLQYHLAYLLGEALSKADKLWYKGGYFTLNKSIKEAKEIYKLHQEYKTILKAFNLPYCFIKKESLLNTLSFLRPLKKLYDASNSKTTQAFFLNLFTQIPFNTQRDFLLKYKGEILEWLESKEFKEKYIKTNHPYPPLLNPSRLSIRVESKQNTIKERIEVRKREGLGNNKEWVGHIKENNKEEESKESGREGIQGETEGERIVGGEKEGRGDNKENGIGGEGENTCKSNEENRERIEESDYKEGRGDNKEIEDKAKCESEDIKDSNKERIGEIEDRDRSEDRANKDNKGIKGEGINRGNPIDLVDKDKGLKEKKLGLKSREFQEEGIKGNREKENREKEGGNREIKESQDKEYKGSRDREAKEKESQSIETRETGEKENRGDSDRGIGEGRERESRCRESKNKESQSIEGIIQEISGQQGENTQETLEPYANLSYESIPAELAWDLNLPLIGGYNGIWLYNSSAGGEATQFFFGYCEGIEFCTLCWRFQECKSAYIYLYQNYLEGKNIIFSFNAWQRGAEKFGSLLDKKVPIFSITRDYISRLKTGVNHIAGTEGITNKFKNFSLKDEIVFPQIYYRGAYKNKPDINIIQKANNFSLMWGDLGGLGLRLKWLKNAISKIYFIPIDEISGERSFHTFMQLSKILHFSIPQNSKAFSGKVNRYEGLIMLPSILRVDTKDINKNTPEIQVLITTYQLHPNHDKRLIDIMNLIKVKAPQDNLVLYVKEEEFKVLVGSKTLLRLLQEYFEKYFKALKGYIKSIQDNLFSEQDILNYFKNHPKLALEFKKQVQGDIEIIKSQSPHIIDSWKYYQEFLRICADANIT